MRNACFASISTKVNLNYVSETLSPGQTCSVQGGGFTPNTKVYIQQIDTSGNPVGTPTTPTITFRNNNLFQVMVPGSFTIGLWRVWVTDDAGVPSVVKYVNQASGIRFLGAETPVQGSLEVWGRNLGGQSGSSPQLRFVANNGNWYATNVTADANHLSCTTPKGLTIGGSYTVQVTNGFGGALGWATINQPLAIRSNGPDYLNLGTSWASDMSFIDPNIANISTAWRTMSNVYNVRKDPRLSLHAIADGTTDDQPAIQAAINMAATDNHGGAVVYLPAGTYRLLSSTNAYCINMASNVVIMGDGMTQTILNCGVTGQSTPNIITAYHVYCSGLMNLRIINNCTNNESLLSGATAPVADKFFLNNVDFNIGFGLQFSFSQTNHLIIENSSIEQDTTTGGVDALGGDTYVELRNDTVSYNNGRLSLHSDYPVVRGCSFICNGAANYYSGTGPLPRETGCIECSYTRYPVISGNTFTVTPGAGGRTGSGEEILTQDTRGYQYFRDSGIITSSSPTTITDNTRSWAPQSPLPSYLACFITSGPALGEWQWVNSISSNTVTLASPWAFTPPVGSRFCINGFTGFYLFALNNTFLDPFNQSVVIYDGGMHCTVSGNSTTSDNNANPYKTAGYRLRISDRYRGADAGWPPSAQCQAVGWENQYFNNSVVNSTASRSAVIECFVTGIKANPVSGELHGYSALNNEFRGNTIDNERGSDPLSYFQAYGLASGVSDNYAHDATLSYVPALAVTLSSEYGNVSFAGQGWVQAGYNNVPAIPSTWQNYSNGKTRLYTSGSSNSSGTLSPSPTGIIIEIGTFDYLNNQPVSSIQSAIKTFISTLRAKVGATPKIIFVDSFGGWSSLRGAFMGGMILQSGPLQRVAKIGNEMALRSSGDHNLYLMCLNSAFSSGLDASLPPNYLASYAKSIDYIHPVSTIHSSIATALYTLMNTAFTASPPFPTVPFRVRK